MPSDKILLQKQEAVKSLAEKLKNSVAGVLVDYKGINVENDTTLRRELREAGIEYSVIKNSILRRACDEAGFDSLKDVLTGTTALALSENDPVAAAKILNKYSEASKGAFSLKAGFVEGNILGVDEVKSLATLPSREELVAKALAGFNAPISGLVNVLNGNIRGLAIVLGQIAEKQQSA